MRLKMGKVTRQMNELDKMTSGMPYAPDDVHLNDLRITAREKTRELNKLTENGMSVKDSLLHDLFGSCGKNVILCPDFRCDYGFNITIGDNVYINFDVVILDCAKVFIGNHCLIGPQVGIYTACHPLDPEDRKSGVEFARPVTLGENCWIGGHATLNPGVQLGNNVVVASGSVVTKSFGDNVVIGGNPAHVLKQLT